MRERAAAARVLLLQSVAAIAIAQRAPLVADAVIETLYKGERLFRAHNRQLSRDVPYRILVVITEHL